MTLAIAATLTGSNDETAELAITGASAPGSVVYTADWSSTVDSWSGATDGAHSAPSPGVGFGWLATGMIYSDQYVKRTLTGLTVGHRYRVVGVVASFEPGLVYFQVDGLTAGDPVAVPNLSSIADWRSVQYEFVAASTSHELRFRRSDDPGEGGLTLISLTVTDIPTTGVGVTIQRTDANGTHFVRLLADALPDGSGNLTVTDEEFALTGLVTWTVRDASGSLASDSLTPGAYTHPLLSVVGFAGTVLPVGRLDGYSGELEYEETKTTLSVIGRADPIVTDRGDYAWSKRKGTLTYHAASYTDAQAIAATYTAGRVALLRQATHPGLDLYHVATRVGASPSLLTATGWTWSVEVEYTEVDWPDGALQGTFGWTFADVASNYLAFYNLPVEFSTFADLAAGP